MLTGVASGEWNTVSSGEYSSLFTTEVNKNTSERQELISVHEGQFNPIGWTNITLQPVLPSVTDGMSEIDGGSNMTTTVIYPSNVSSSYLCSSTMGIIAPETELKEEYKLDYRFKLVDDFGYKVANRGVFGANKVNINALDPHSQIFFREKMTPAGEMKAMKRRMGLDTVCKEWTTYIPPTKLYYRQQFPYSFWPSAAFPTGLLGSSPNMYHRYDMILDMKYLVNVRRFNHSKCEWELVTQIDPSIFNKLGKVSIPSFVIRVSNISPPEVEARLANKVNTFYILDMITCDAPNKHKPGSDVSTVLPVFEGLVQVLFWGLENLTYESANITCNYTVDPLQTKHSKIPIIKNKLTTANGEKLSDICSELLNGEYQYGILPNAGDRNGILCNPYIEKLGPGNNGGSTPQNMGTKITCTIVNRPQDKGSKYALICRALVLKKMIISQGGHIIIGI